MEFSEKLQKIRKEHNITQENLADKLGVSRQAVSKWESGSAYPDTEKLIQISKIFNVSLDELISPNIDPNKTIKNKKFNFLEIINLILEFIQKSFTMFWSMKFKEKIKCLFEMLILALGIIFIAYILNMIIIEIIRRIFIFIPHDVTRVIIAILESLLYIVWTIIAVIILIRIFKTRYLDYYIIIKDKNIEKTELEEPIKELKEKKDYKVVIRDPKDSSLNFIKIFAKFILFILKCLSLLIVIPTLIIFIFLLCIFVYSLSYTFSGLFFVGISIAILGCIIFTYLIIEFIYDLIFNQKHLFKRIFIIFILSLCLLGIGCGLSLTSLTDFTILEDTNREIKTFNIDMDDKLIISEITNIPKENIIIDNSLNYIKIEISTKEFTNVDLYTHYVYDNKNIEYKFIGISTNYNNLNIYKKIIENVKNKKICLYNDNYQITKITISKENLTKLKENQSNFFKY